MSDLQRIVSGGTRTTSPSPKGLPAEYVSGVEGWVGPISGKVGIREDEILAFSGSFLRDTLTSERFDCDFRVTDIAALSVVPADQAGDTLRRVVVGFVLAGGVGALIGALRKSKGFAAIFIVDSPAGRRTWVFTLTAADARVLADAVIRRRGPLPGVDQLAGGEAAASQEALLAAILAELQEQSALLRRIAPAGTDRRADEAYTELDREP